MSKSIPDQPAYFIGIDVQINRPCPFYILRKDLDFAGSGWLAGEDRTQVSRSLQQLAESLAGKGEGSVLVGIDAPRRPLLAPRPYYWRNGTWIRRSGSERGYGRHCEVVIKALRIANPQWTPLIGEAPAWMELGFALFQSVAETQSVYEVFPTASYRLLAGSGRPPIPISFKDFSPGPKDMLDAAVAAYTLFELAAGRGSEIGGGDGLGTIAIPTRLNLPDSHPLLSWPE